MRRCRLSSVPRYDATFRMRIGTDPAMPRILVCTLPRHMSRHFVALSSRNTTITTTAMQRPHPRKTEEHAPRQLSVFFRFCSVGRLQMPTQPITCEEANEREDLQPKRQVPSLHPHRAGHRSQEDDETDEQRPGTPICPMLAPAPRSSRRRPCAPPSCPHHHVSSKRCKEPHVLWPFIVLTRHFCMAGAPQKPHGKVQRGKPIT